MRWPWEWVPWGRGRGADASDSAAGDAASPAAGSAVPASTEAFPSAPDARSAAWSRLPPLQRTVADGTAVAPPAAFRAALTTHQNPSFLAPLGHLVDPDGPAGVVGGLASSVGGPISYEGVDELRVPERPAPPAAPAVQRRIATLRPEPPAVQRHEDADTPTYGPGHDHHDPPQTEHTATEHTATEHTESGPDVGEPAAGEPVALETPVAAPLVVSRSTAAPQPPPSVRPDSDSTDSTGSTGSTGSTEEIGPGQTGTLGAGENPVGATGGLGASTDAAVLPPAPAPPLTPLTVPVQRSVAPGDPGSGSTAPPGRVGDLRSAVTLRPVPAPPPSVAVPSPIQKVEAGSAAATAPDDPVETPASQPSPTAASDPVVARTAAEPVVREADHPTSDGAPPPAGEDAVAELLSSRPPIVKSPLIDAGPTGEVTAGDTAPLTVPSVGNPLGGSGPTLQRQFTDHPGATPPAPSTPASPVVSPVGSSGVVSMSAARPDVPTAAVEPPRSPAAGQDDQEYPPLIARSVQRSTDGTPDAGRAPAPDVAAPQPTPDAPGTAPQAPLSGFSAAISALHDSPIGAAPGDHGEDSTDGPGWSSPDPVLVVARRVAPDQTGQLPVPEVRLQRTIGATRRLAPPSTLVQRTLIAGGSPLAAPPALGSATPAASTPAVQRLRYEDVADPTGSHLTVDQPAGADDVQSTGGEHGGSTMELLTAHASAAWSPVALTPTASAPASLRSGASPAAVQRAEAATSLPTVGTTTSSRGGEPPAPMLSPPASGGDPAPMIQRRFDAPSPGTTVAPPTSVERPTSVEPPALAVSSRTVGLAEMFALAAARSSDGDATIQRSAETDVPAASDPPASTPAATGSAAPAGPAGPAAPPSGAELEEMARRLYEPLSARLRAELWQDRERSGLLTDLRP